MTVKLNVRFPCPNCGDKSACLEEVNGDFHAGETYACTGCGGQVVFVALSLEMLANPRHHPVGLPLLPARTLLSRPVS